MIVGKSVGCTVMVGAAVSLVGMKVMVGSAVGRAVGSCEGGGVGLGEGIGDGACEGAGVWPKENTALVVFCPTAKPVRWVQAHVTDVPV